MMGILNERYPMKERKHKVQLIGTCGQKNSMDSKGYAVKQTYIAEGLECRFGNQETHMNQTE